jgi:YVTN family beta-propeller protein
MRTRLPARIARRIGWFIGLALTAWSFSCAVGSDELPAEKAEYPIQQHVGPAERGGMIVPTGQLIHPAGQTFAFGGRPVDIAISPDRNVVFVKNVGSLMVVDASRWQSIQNLAYPKDEAGSMHGMAVSRDGAAVYVAGSYRRLLEARRDDKGRWQWARTILLGKKTVNPSGIALSADGRTAYVGLSITNTLAIVDLVGGTVTAQIPTGVCPFDVLLSADGHTAYVSNFGGRRARKGDHAELSVGTPVVVDDRSLSISGTITRIDLKGRMANGELSVGLHPSDMALSTDGARLFVANANSDSVSVVETASFRVREMISVRPDPTLPFGSITNALAVSKDGRMLFVANGGNNAVAVVKLAATSDKSSAVSGFIPTGWFPGGVCTDGANLYIANVKGEGSRQPPAKKTVKKKKKEKAEAAADEQEQLARNGAASAQETVAVAWNSHEVRGSVTKVAIPDDAQLAALTKQTLSDARVPQMLLALEKAHCGVKPLPVPLRSREPSTIEHVVYVIKENRTYDQVLGDLRQGNGDAKLCTYGRRITPNHHALAEEFVLLDNYYCNGVLSADGHQWATQGAIGDYQEKAFGGHPRSYFFGTDPLAYAGCNFIWDSALLQGRSFRNYGEFDVARIVPGGNWFDVYRDFQNKAGKFAFKSSLRPETLRKYSCLRFPGWDLAIPDVLRLGVFLKEFKQYEQSGDWPNLIIVYLPQDHTAGTDSNYPTPRAMVADNDLAVGRLVEAISHSRFWPKTAIFVNEDDPQDGWDHVDGHRSLCLVISPYVKRHAVVSRFYNQLSVLHTMERILGLPSAAQLTAQAPTMDACFTETADLTPYKARPNIIPLDEPNKQASELRGIERELARASEAMDFSVPDRINEDKFNRILWHASMGADTPYPARFAGAHGRGLKVLGLKPVASEDDDD